MVYPFPFPRSVMLKIAALLKEEVPFKFLSTYVVVGAPANRSLNNVAGGGEIAWTTKRMLSEEEANSAGGGAEVRPKSRVEWS